MVAIIVHRTDGIRATPNRQTIATSAFVGSTLNFVQRSAVARLGHIKPNLWNHLCVYPHVKKTMVDIDPAAFASQLQIFNVSDFSPHVHRQSVMIDIESITPVGDGSLNRFLSQSNH